MSCLPPPESCPKEKVDGRMSAQVVLEVVEEAVEVVGVMATIDSPTLVIMEEGVVEVAT